MSDAERWRDARINDVDLFRVEQAPAPADLAVSRTLAFDGDEALEKGIVGEELIGAYSYAGRNVLVGRWGAPDDADQPCGAKLKSAVALPPSLTVTLWVWVPSLSCQASSWDESCVPAQPTPSPPPRAPPGSRLRSPMPASSAMATPWLGWGRGASRAR